MEISFVKGVMTPRQGIIGGLFSIMPHAMPVSHILR